MTLLILIMFKCYIWVCFWLSGSKRGSRSGSRRHLGNTWEQQLKLKLHKLSPVNFWHDRMTTEIYTLVHITRRRVCEFLVCYNNQRNLHISTRFTSTGLWIPYMIQWPKRITHQYISWCVCMMLEGPMLLKMHLFCFRPCFWQVSWPPSLTSWLFRLKKKRNLSWPVVVFHMIVVPATPFDVRPANVFHVAVAPPGHLAVVVAGFTFAPANTPSKSPSSISGPSYVCFFITDFLCKVWLQKKHRFQQSKGGLQTKHWVTQCLFHILCCGQRTQGSAVRAMLVHVRFPWLLTMGNVFFHHYGRTFSIYEKKQIFDVFANSVVFQQSGWLFLRCRQGKQGIVIEAMLEHGCARSTLSTAQGLRVKISICLKLFYMSVKLFDVIAFLLWY